MLSVGPGPVLKSFHARRFHSSGHEPRSASQRCGRPLVISAETLLCSMRCLVRDAEDAGLADGCSLSALRSLQEQTFTDDIPLQLPRMRFWRPSVALAYFESGAQPKALPSHWRCISLTHGLTLSKQEEEARSSAIEWLAASGSSSQDHYTIRDGSVAFALGSPHPEWVDELRECGDRSCACYRLASGSSSASVREEFVRHII